LGFAVNSTLLILLMCLALDCLFFQTIVVTQYVWIQIAIHVAQAFAMLLAYSLKSGILFSAPSRWDADYRCTTIMSDYPRICRPPLAPRIFLAAIGLALFLPLWAVVVSFQRDGSQSLFVWCAAGVIAMFGILAINFAFMGKAILYEDRLEKTGMFGTTSIRRQDIKGYRITSVKGAASIDLIPIDSQIRGLSIPHLYANDPVLRAWLEGFRELDMLGR
jgi:hypothetical protein